ncbi:MULTISPECIES: hypothetical protein [Streptomyces]|uniref:hypothetical protein n=1 Tax=Streptomyces TaxID=1883 RepID=UPI001603D843|nr:hypothetical protein [Streptomyces murinus]MBA9050776.1 outer membrane biogenesis lipoprotein LolB [Streptomyces murinus]
MRILNTAISAAAILALAGCSSQSKSPTVEPMPPKTTSAEPTFNQDDAKHEAWEQARDTYPAELKLSICDAAKKSGTKGVKAVLTDPDQMPFVVERPDYDAAQWVSYCASK